MIGELFINGKDAYREWGVNMGNGFLDALEEPAGLKEYISNNNRLEDGRRYTDAVPKTDERNVTLTFTITGISSDDYNNKRRGFFSELYKGNVILKVPANSSDVYHLKYKNSTGMYAQNLARTFGKVGIKFIEPNVKNRT